MYRNFARKDIVTTIHGLLVAAAATAVTLPATASGEDHQSRAETQVFLTLDNPAVPNFNQLLSINDQRIIVGDGGNLFELSSYILLPRNHYSPDVFTQPAPGISVSQTRVSGINSKAFADVVGSYVESATTFSHGFLDSNGVQTTIDDPAGLPPNVNRTLQSLFAINDSGKAAGYWLDTKGFSHGFVVKLNMASPGSSQFKEISPANFHGAVETLARGITDNDNVCGSWTDANGNNHGFYGHLGHHLSSFMVQINGAQAVSTSALGCNNEGEIVGSFIDATGANHGFIWKHGRFSQFDAPGSSQTQGLFMGTTVSGINDRGDIVGYYSDGTNVHGFARFVADEDGW